MNSPEPESVSTPVTLQHSWLYHVFLWTAFPLLGAAGGRVLSQIPRLVSGLAWVPFEGPLALIEQVSGRWGLVVLIIAGAIVGGVIAFSAYEEIVRITIDSSTVKILGPGSTTASFDRAQIGAVFVDQKDLVLTGPDGHELLRQATDFERKQLKTAFEKAACPWSDVDPFASDYSRWAAGMPGLPAGADAYLAARQEALEKGDSENAAELRAELIRLNMVARDEKKHQYWRLVRD